MKIIDEVMVKTIVLKPACEGRNIQNDFNLILDIEERITEKFWNVELMYAYCPKKTEEFNEAQLNQQPPKKKRKLNNTKQCRTGYIKVIKMEPCN